MRERERCVGDVVAGLAIVADINRLLRSGHATLDVAGGDRDLREPVQAPRNRLGVTGEAGGLDVTADRVNPRSKYRALEHQP